jgi:hypothetical protein
LVGHLGCGEGVAVYRALTALHGALLLAAARGGLALLTRKTDPWGRGRVKEVLLIPGAAE